MAPDAGAPEPLPGAASTAATGRPPWKLRAGLTLYDRLAGRARPRAARRWCGARDALALEPGPRSRAGCAAPALYSDVVMDDARLAVAVARDAAAHGAEIHTYTEVVGARPGRATARSS